MILDDLFQNDTSSLAEKTDLGPRLGTKRDQGRILRKWHKSRLGEQDSQDMAEAMKPSDIPTVMRSNRLTMRDIEKERPQGAYRFRVGDNEFMDLDAAREFARGTGETVKPIGQSTLTRSPARFRVIDPRDNRPAATFDTKTAADSYAAKVNGRVETIREAVKKKLENQQVNNLDEIENPFQQPAPIRSKDPITGKQIEPEYTPSEVPPQYADYQSNLARYMAKYGQPAAEPAVAVAPAAPTTITPAATTVPTAGKTAKVGAPAGKAALDTAVKTIDTVRSDRRQAVIDYGQDLLTAAEKKLASSRRKAPAATTIPAASTISAADTTPAAATAPAAPAAEPTQTFQPKTPTPPWVKGDPIRIGKQVIKPTDPNYNKVADALSKQGITEKKRPVPTNKPLWGRAKAAARSKFDVYPSAYANAWAAKWYKSHGGGWRMGKGAKK